MTGIVKKLIVAVPLAACVSACSSPPRGITVSEEMRQVNGTELFVKRMGSGEPVVVIHGGPVLEHGYLLPYLALLADAYELVFFDQRLSGRSAGQVDSSSVRLATFVDDIEALRQSLGLGQIHVMGHSWGGLLAMHYALGYSQNLKSLILLNSMSASSELWQEEETLLLERRTVEDSVEMAAIRQSGALASGQPDAIADMLRTSFKAQFSDRSKISELNLFVPEDYLERSRQFGFLASDLMVFNLHDELEAVSARTLILYGSVEPAVGLGGAALHEHIPGSELEIIEDAGHFPFIEQPDAFLQTVRGFLDSVSGHRH